MKIRDKLIVAFLSVLIPVFAAAAYLLVREWRPQDALLLGACGFRMVSAVVALGRHFSAPVERLLRASRSLSKGVDRPEGRRTGDEFELLAQAFDGMAARLLRRERELEEHKARLEDVLRALPD